ncbi:MAG TPA: SusD/RagB family nutrient-binding outer membrane lipoprotein [Gemmatimonadaceae bacterium]
MRFIKYAAVAGLCGMTSISGCNNFLNSEKAVADPNNPTAATTNQLFVASLANIFGQQEGPVAMNVCEWMQQCAGVGGRFVEVQGTYAITSDSFDGSFQSVYTGGGLNQIRAIEANTDASGDKLYHGIAEVLEAMDVLWGTDIWGDMPYSDAVGANPTPKFDPQQTIYASLLTLLDKAIADLAAGGTGPGAYDLVYGGNATNWTEAAHTLKARIYLHQEEKLGASQYTSALAEARKGISKPADDWKTVHSSATSERNLWAQFQLTSFGQDLVAGSALVNLMLAQNDPRLPDYFAKNSHGGYGGYNVATQTTPADSVSSILGSGRTNDVTFSQPIITYDETQLIIAEAAFQTNDKASAATALNNVRTEHGKSAIASPTLADIMNEKYIALFQNVETWNDYKRTCLPALKPAKSKLVIPGRFLYGSTEVQTNPDNAAAEHEQPLSTGRNWNDPNACT